MGGVEARAWGVEDEGGPVAEEDDDQGDDLVADAAKAEEEQEAVAEANLAESVFESVIGLGLTDGPQEDAEGDEDEGTPEGVGGEQAF